MFIHQIDLCSTLSAREGVKYSFGRHEKVPGHNTIENWVEKFQTQLEGGTPWGNLGVDHPKGVPPYGIPIVFTPQGYHPGLYLHGGSPWVTSPWGYPPSIP